MAGPQPVVFGESWGVEQPPARYAALQYKFKPQSACQGRSGSLCIENDTVTLRRSGGGEGGSLFEGQWAPAAQGAECVAIFENGQWRLELIAGNATNLRHIPTPSKPASSPAPRSPAPQRSAEEEAEAQGLSHERELQSQTRRLPSSLPSSVTPSVAGPLSRDTSLSGSAEAAAAGQPRQAQAAGRPISAEHLGPSPAASPSITRPPGSSSKLSAPSSSSTSSESDPGREQEVAKPPAAAAQAAQARPSAPGGDVPDFERDFFADQSDEDASSSSASESSGHDSEEEAKHF